MPTLPTLSVAHEVRAIAQDNPQEATETPCVPLGLRLWGVMLGDTRPESEFSMVTHAGEGPLAMVIQAESAKAAYDVLVAMPAASWITRRVRNLDQWIAEHIMEIPSKDEPAVLMVVRKDYDA